MQEIEVKILEIDQKGIRRKLRDLGAKPHFSGILQAQFFDFEDRSIISRGDVLRLRQEGEVTKLTYKQNLSRDGAKVMEEMETTVGKPEETSRLLSALGLKIIKETRKWREVFLLDEVQVVIDRYEGAMAAIPPFLEIEARNKADLLAAVTKLGYTPEDCLSWSTYELMQHYGVKG